MSSDAAASPAASAVVDQEQLTNARRTHRVRFWGVTAFFALHLWLGVVLNDASWQGNLPLFAGYWCAAAAVHFWGSRHPRVARVATLSTAFLDMPMVMLLQLGTYATTPDPKAVAGYSLGLFVLLLVLAALSLKQWQLGLTAAMGAGCEVVLQAKAGISVGAQVTTVMVMAFAASLMAYGSRRMRELIEATAKREKMAVLGQVSAGIGHDLRNPLAAVTTSLYVLRRRLMKTAFLDDARNLEVLELADREAKRCATIANELLDYARERPLELQPTDVSLLLKETFEVTRARPDVRLESAVPEGLPMLLLEPDRFRQVLVNLVQNAIDAIPEGRPGSVRVGASLASGRVLLEVEDDGDGIAPERLERIFEPLFTTKKAGTGLGLAIVETLVKQHRGTIAVRSTPGKGTVFTLSLPAAMSEPVPG